MEFIMSLEEEGWFDVKMLNSKEEEIDYPY